MVASGVAPGWYADAANPALIRWWDGAAWSEHTQPNPSAPSPPSAPQSNTLPLPAGPYVPPPFADPAPAVPASSAPTSAIPAMPTAATTVPPPPVSVPLASAPTPERPAAAPLSPTPYSPAIGSASTPGSRRRTAPSLPVSEPVRLVPPTSDSVGVAGFPGFDEPSASSPTYPSASFSASPPTGTPWATATPFAGAAAFAQPNTSSVDLASVDYEPMTRTWGSKRAASERVASGASTGGSWMLALSPLVFLGFAALGWWLTEGGTLPTAPYVIGGLAALAVLWLFVGAVSDYRRLGSLGHEHRASVAWVIAGPFFYLLVRAIHVHRTLRTGTAPTWVYVILSIAVGVAAAALSLFIPRQVGATELRVIETQLTADFLQQGLDYSVLCPTEAPGAIGSSFFCTAYDGVDPAAIIRVTWVGLGEFDYVIE